MINHDLETGEGGADMYDTADEHSEVGADDTFLEEKSSSAAKNDEPLIILSGNMSIEDLDVSCGSEKNDEGSAENGSNKSDAEDDKPCNEVTKSSIEETQTSNLGNGSDKNDDVPTEDLLQASSTNIFPLNLIDKSGAQRNTVAASGKSENGFSKLNPEYNTSSNKVTVSATEETIKKPITSFKNSGGHDQQYSHVSADKSEEDESVEASPPVSLTRKLISEVIGTAILVHFGCGSVCANVYTGALIGLGQSTTIWSIGAALAIYASASISGGHLNPAVSLAFASVRPKDFPWKHVIPYWLAQLLGAFIAGAVNYGLFNIAIADYEKANGIERGVNSEASAVGFGGYWSIYVSGPGEAFLIEAWGTAMLTFVIFNITHSSCGLPSSAVPAVVGVAIGSIIAIIGSLSGGAINPARDLGPRIVTALAGWGKDSMAGVWVYMVGPLLGGVFGAMISENVYNRE